MKSLRFFSFLAVFLLVSSVSFSDVGFGIEGSLLQRDVLDLTGTASTEEETRCLSYFFGFEWGRSMFYIRRSNETLSDAEADRFERTETSFDWHWNEGGQDGTFSHFSLGILMTDYSIPVAGTAELVGGSIGVGTTQYLGGSTFFVTARGQLRVLFADSQQVIDWGGEEGARSFTGYVLQGSIGAAFGYQPSLSVQAGVRLRNTDFDGLYPEDEAIEFFLALRLFFSS